ncbi:hypothetical protein MLD38_011475 [Melastoma candidum]|uniref:Uncharacterized protein n=1 Tax=Melastoma candidum TaxID=119954 RepID=A0ACB9RBI4_9MYRT|nr:hypothetical protein MLD38_011475 [Melastoma candidum]
MASTDVRRGGRRLRWIGEAVEGPIVVATGTLVVGSLLKLTAKDCCQLRGRLGRRASTGVLEVGSPLLDMGSMAAGSEGKLSVGRRQRKIVAGPTYCSGEGRDWSRCRFAAVKEDAKEGLGACLVYCWSAALEEGSRLLLAEGCKIVIRSWFIAPGEETGAAGHPS